MVLGSALGLEGAARSGNDEWVVAYEAGHLGVLLAARVGRYSRKAPGGSKHAFSGSHRNPSIFGKSSQIPP